MSLESVHDTLFGLAYILGFAFDICDQVDEIVEPAGECLTYYVDSPPAGALCFPSFGQYLQFRVFLKILVGLMPFAGVGECFGE